MVMSEADRSDVSDFLEGKEHAFVELVRSLEDIDEEMKISLSYALLDAFPGDFKRMGVSPNSAHSFVTQSFRAHNGMLSLWHRGSLVATAGYSMSGGTYFVTNVYTNKRFRGMGVARHMVSEAEKEIKAKGCEVSRVWCTRDLSRAYESMGYSPEMRDYRVSRDYYVDVLSKNLSP
jgi:ribosomal protein S18 acetylase RimI-like enzyme